jgi:hypothetical protein
LEGGDMTSHDILIGKTVYEQKNVNCLVIWLSKTFDFWSVCRKCIRLIEWWILGGRAFLIGYLLCVINSSSMFRLTFFKPCTVVMDTLKMCMWLSGRLQTLFDKFTCSWT